MLKKVIFYLLLLNCVILNAQEWEPMHTIPFERNHYNGFGIDGKGYVIAGGGGANGFASNEFWEYDAETDSWTALENFPGAPRGLAIGDDWNGNYYFGFGFSDEFEYLNDLWVFDPISQTFTELPSCPCEGRQHPAFVAHNDKIFMGAGSGIDDDLDDWWVYDMLTEEWSQKFSIPGGIRHHPFQFGIDNRIYVGGGHVDSWFAYDIATEEWETAINDYPKGRVAGTQFSYNGKGYVLSGDDADHEALEEGDYFLEYDAELDTWTVLPSHPDGSKWAPSSFIIDGYVYFFGGYENGDGDDTRMWRYLLEEMISPSNEVQNTIEMTVSPNPFQDEITIDIPKEVAEKCTITVSNLLGKSIYTQENSQLSTIDLSSLSTGVYLLTIETREVLISKKIIKE